MAGKCESHEAIMVQIGALEKTDTDQWTQINGLKKDLLEMPRTKTLLVITTIVVGVLLVIFGVVWAEIGKTKDATMRIEKQLERILPDNTGTGIVKERRV